MKRFFIAITLALGLSLSGLAVTAGASNASSEVNVMLATYNQIHAELNSPTVTKAAVEALFIKFSSEAVVMAGEDHLRSKTINADIRAYAVAANNWAWVGYTTVVSNASNLGPWKAANNNLNAVIAKFTNDLKAGK